jgi:hypothetical protein
LILATRSLIVLGVLPTRKHPPELDLATEEGMKLALDISSTILDIYISIYI